MQRRLDPETKINKFFENVFMSGAYSEFFREGAPIFVTFQAYVFWQI